MFTDDGDRPRGSPVQGHHNLILSFGKAMTNLKDIDLDSVMVAGIDDDIMDKCRYHLKTTIEGVYSLGEDLAFKHSRLLRNMESASSSSHAEARASLEEEKEGLVSKVTLLQTLLDESEDEISRLQRQLQEEKDAKAAAPMSSASEKDVQGVFEDRARLTAEVATLRNEMQNGEFTRESLRQENTTLQNLLSETRERMSALHDTHGHTLSDNRELRRRLKEMSDNASSNALEQEEASLEVVKLRAQAAKFSAEYRAWEEERESTRLKIAQLRMELREAQDQVEELELAPATRDSLGGGLAEELQAAIGARESLPSPLKPVRLSTGGEVLPSSEQQSTLQTTPGINMDKELFTLTVTSLCLGDTTIASKGGFDLSDVTESLWKDLCTHDELPQSAWDDWIRGHLPKVIPV